MEYGTFTTQPAAPATEQPSSGISTGGVLTLVVAVAVAVVLRRTGRGGGKPLAPGTTAGPGPVQKVRDTVQEKLPTVSMDELRGDCPARSPGEPAESTVESPADAVAEKGRSILGAPAAKAWAHKLGIPYELAQRLQKGAWSAMCRSRGLAGLERGGVEKADYGVMVHVEFRGRLDFPSVQRGIDQIEAGLDVGTGTIRLRRGTSAGRGVLDVRLRDPLAGGIPWEQSPVPVRLAHPMRLSVTAFGDTQELSLKQRIGIFGTSGSGKSCVQRLIGAHASQAIDADLEIWDLKFGVESQHYEGKAHRVTTVEDAVDRLDWLMETEFPRRAAKMKERGVSEWVETPWDPARLVMIDEGNGVVRGFGEWREEGEEGQPAGPKGLPLKRLFTAFEQGRALGVYFVWATQFPKATNLPTEIRSQLNATVCLKLRTDGEARVVFGDDDVSAGWAPQDLYGPGWLLVQDDSHTEPVDAKAVWLSTDTFRGLSCAVPDSPADSGQDKDRTPLVSRTPGQSLSPDCPAAVPVLSAVPDRTASTVSMDVWTVLLLSEDSPTLSEIARRTGRPKSSVHAALAKLTEDGRAVKEGDGFRLRVADCG